MEGGGSGGSIRLGDIGDYMEVNDFYPIGSATLVAMNLALALGKLGAVGGVSFTAYFDAFGLEGIMANMSLVFILLQIARWLYTSFYAAGKPWSPLVFISILIGIQIVHDLLFYYGAINVLPSGKNEMIDALKQYARENGSRAVGGHSVFLVGVAVIAMYLKETSRVFGFIVTSLSVYLMPYVISTLSRKPVAAAPVAKAARPEEKEGMQQRVEVRRPTMYGANGMLQ